MDGSDLHGLAGGLILIVALFLGGGAILAARAVGGMLALYAAFIICPLIGAYVGKQVLGEFGAVAGGIGGFLLVMRFGGAVLGLFAEKPKQDQLQSGTEVGIERPSCPGGDANREPETDSPTRRAPSKVLSAGSGEQVRIRIIDRVRYPAGSSPSEPPTKIETTHAGAAQANSVPSKQTQPPSEGCTLQQERKALDSQPIWRSGCATALPTALVESPNVDAGGVETGSGEIWPSSADLVCPIERLEVVPAGPAIVRLRFTDGEPVSVFVFGLDAQASCRSFVQWVADRGAGFDYKWSDCIGNRRKWPTVDSINTEYVSGHKTIARLLANRAWGGNGDPVVGIWDGNRQCPEALLLRRT